MKPAFFQRGALFFALFYIGGVGCSPSISPSQKSSSPEIEQEPHYERLIYEAIPVEKFQREALPSAISPTPVRAEPTLFQTTRLSEPIPDVCKDALPKGIHAYTFQVEGEAHPREVRDKIESENGVVSWQPAGSIQIQGKVYPVLSYIVGFCASEIIDLGLRIFYAGAPSDGFAISKPDLEDKSIPILHNRYIISVSPNRIAVLDLETGRVYEDTEQFSQFVQKEQLLDPVGFFPVFPSPPIFYSLRERKRGCIIYFPGRKAEDPTVSVSVPPRYIRVEW